MVEVGKIFKQGEQASMHPVARIGFVCDMCMCVSISTPAAIYN